MCCGSHASLPTYIRLFAGFCHQSRTVSPTRITYAHIGLAQKRAEATPKRCSAPTRGVWASLKMVPLLSLRRFPFDLLPVLVRITHLYLCICGKKSPKSRESFKKRPTWPASARQQSCRRTNENVNEKLATDATHSDWNEVKPKISQVIPASRDPRVAQCSEEEQSREETWAPLPYVSWHVLAGSLVLRSLI